MLYLAGDGVRERLDALLELGLFDQVGVLITNFRVGDVVEEEREFVRSIRPSRAICRSGGRPSGWATA